MVALVVVIGALGAIALPRLLHNTATSGRGLGSGHVCLALPVVGGLESAGTIRITSSDRSDPILVIPGIEKVKEVAGIIDETRLQERLRRGLHIESI